MGSFKELGDLIRDTSYVLKDMKSKADDIKGVSIAKRSSASTLQFPIIVSRSINVDTASNVVKALERQYAIFVQMVVSLNPILDLNRDPDIGSFVKRLHQNNPVPMDLVESCINVYSDEAYNLRLITSINEGCNGQVLRANKEQLMCIEDCLNQTKINDLYKPEQMTLEQANAHLDYYMLYEAKVRDRDVDNINDDDDNADIKLRKLNMKHQLHNDAQRNRQNQAKFDYDVEKDEADAAFRQRKFEYDAARDEIDDAFKRAEFNYKVEKDEADREYKAAQDAINNAMKDAEFKHKQEMDRISTEFKNDEFAYRKAKDKADRAYNVLKDKFDRDMKTAEFNYKVTSDKIDKEFKSAQFKYQQAKDKDDRDFKKQQFQFEKEKDKQKNELEKIKLQRELDKANAEYRSRAIVKLSDSDIKKCNELVPTTLSVTLQQIKGDNFGGNVNFVLGIKGLMHPVNSDEMVSNLLDGYKAGNKFFNFLRWTSGEITFLKDLLFNVDGIKEDVIKKHSKGSHWWTTLKRNRTLARVKNTYGKNKILPNATIVCSMEEVMEIKDTYNVDLMDPRHVMRLMDRYFLLGFVIVDESQELSYFMFDGEREFQALSFKGLERENNNKNDFKDIYKMINSGRL